MPSGWWRVPDPYGASSLAIRVMKMKVAAYQCSLLGSMSMSAVDLISDRVRWSEANGVEILCCPEAVLGGLADYAEDPAAIAFTVEQVGVLLKPLASQT